MPDETAAGVAPAEQVAGTTATPPAAPSPATPVSSDLEAVIDARLDKFAEGLAKRLRQSQKDVIEDRLEKMLSKHFGQPAQASPQNPEPPAPTAPPQATPAEQVSSNSGFDAEIQGILNEHRLTGGEPELQEFAQANKGQPWYRVGPAFAELAAKIAGRSAGSPGGVTVPTGQKPPSPDLAQQYVEEIAAARVAKKYGAAVLRDIKTKYRKLGLAVENVRFELDNTRIPARGKTDGLS